MIQKYKTFAIAIAIAVALSLSACGSGSNVNVSASSEQTTSADSKNTIGLIKTIMVKVGMEKTITSNATSLFASALREYYFPPVASFGNSFMDEILQPPEVAAMYMMRNPTEDGMPTADSLTEQNAIRSDMKGVRTVIETTWSSERRIEGLNALDARSKPIAPEHLAAAVVMQGFEAYTAWPLGLMPGQAAEERRRWAAHMAAYAEVGADVIDSITQKLESDVLQDEAAAKREIVRQFRELDPWKIVKAGKDAYQKYKAARVVFDFAGAHPSPHWQYDGVDMEASQGGFTMIKAGEVYFSPNLIHGKETNFRLLAARDSKMEKRRDFSRETGTGTGQSIGGKTGVDGK